jgi:hypothetical protein
VLLERNVSASELREQDRTKATEGAVDQGEEHIKGYRFNFELTITEQVGCKARFVIRKVNHTGEYSATYYCKRNPLR